MTQFESGVKIIPYSQERVYSKVSDLNSLEAIKDRVPDKVQDLNFDEDSVSFNVAPVGNVSLHIVDREPSKCVKFETLSSPLPFFMWIQLLPVAENQCKMKVTVKVELSPFIKGMVSKPLQEGLEKMADMLSAIPY